MASETSSFMPSPFVDLHAPLSPADKTILDGWISVAKQVRPVLFVGAGMSFNAEPIAGWQQRVPREHRSSVPRCLSWKELTTRFRSEMHSADQREQDYLRLAEYFEKTHGRHRLHMLLQDSVPDHLLVPGDAHRTIVETNWEAILTTNYDTLIEKSYQSSWRRGEPNIIYRDLDLARPRRPGAACDIIHLHGIISDPGSIILTAEDYRLYKDRHPGLLVKMQQLFVQHPVMIVGFSLDDPNFYIINGWVGDLLGPNRPPVICIQTEPSSQARHAHCRSHGIQILALAGTENNQRQGNKEMLTSLLQYVSNKLANSDSPEELILHGRLRENLIKRYIEDAVDLQSSIRGLEYIFSLFPADLRSAHLERQEAWEAVAKWIAQHSEADMWNRFFLLTKKQWLEHKKINEQLGEDYQTPEAKEHCPDEPVPFLLKYVLDDVLACRWLYLGIIHLGGSIEFLRRMPCDLVGLIKQDRYYSQLQQSEKDRIIIEQIGQASAENQLERAKNLTDELITRSPSKDILDQLHKIWTLHRFRYGDSLWDLSDLYHEFNTEQFSAHDLNLQGAQAIWHGDFDKAASLYELARERARSEGNSIAEWVSLEGLARIDIKNIKDRIKKTNLKHKQEVLDIRYMQLSRESDVRNLIDMFDRAQKHARESLIQGLQEELQTLQSNAERSRSMRFVPMDDLIDTLADQEYLGLPPDYCAKTVELIGSLAFLQGGYSSEVVELLMRYGSPSLSALFKSYSLYGQAESEEKADEILGKILSPGRNLTEWFAKLKALSSLIDELKVSQVNNCKEFLDKLELALRPNSDGTYGLFVQGRHISSSTVWSIQREIVKIAYKLSDYVEDGPQWIQKFLDSEKKEIRISAMENLQLIDWEEWITLGVLKISAIRDISLILTRFLERDLGENNFGNFELMGGIFIGLRKLFSACRSNGEIFEGSTIAELRAATVKLIEKYLANAKRKSRYKWIYNSIIEIVKLMNNIESLNKLIHDDIVAELRYIKSIKLPTMRAERLAPLAKMVSQLTLTQIKAVLQDASSLLSRLSDGDEGVAAIVTFAVRILQDGPEANHDLALQVLKQGINLHPDSVLAIAALPREKIAAIWGLLDESVRERLKGLDKRAGHRQAPPWRTLHNSDYGISWTWRESIRAGLSAVINYTWINSELPPNEWVEPVWIYANNPDESVAATALNALGRLGRMAHKTSSAKQFLSTFHHALSHSKHQVRGEAAFWIGYLSNKGKLFHQLVDAKKLNKTLESEKAAYVFYRWKMGRAQGRL